MLTSKNIKRQARKLFKLCKVNNVLDENRVRLAVEGLIQRKPRGHLQILKFFKRLVKLEIDKKTAIVEIAIAIDNELKNSIIENVMHLYGKDLRLSFITNSSLIGGMKVKVGSSVYDNTIITRLNELLEQF